MRLHKLVFILLVICVLAAPMAAPAKPVTVNRILLDHNMYVVTTQKPESLSKFLFEMQLMPKGIMSILDLRLNPKKGDEDSLLFIVDRSKLRRLTPEEESLLPCPLAAINANQVIMYSKKANGRNAWEIMISAPNEKWLTWELNRFRSSLLGECILNERGSIIDNYEIQALRVISTEGKQLADDWVNGQMRNGGDRIEMDFIPVDSFAGTENEGLDTVLLIDRQKVAEKWNALAPVLPKGLQLWSKTDGFTMEIAAEKQTLEMPNGKKASLYAVVAPCARQLKLATEQYSSLGAIPESLTQRRLHDLANYKRLTLITKANDESAIKDSAMLNDLAGKLTTALSVTQTGFQCISRQDLKELIYTALQSGNSDHIDSMQLTDIRKKAGNTYAIVVADLSAANLRTTYTANTPQCQTTPYAAFTKREPSEPQHPDANEKRLFGGHTYGVVNGRRENDPKYIKDHRNYHEYLLPKYNREKYDWDREKQDYDYKRQSHEMSWDVSVDAIQSVKISGNLRIYDIGSLSEDTAGQVVFSCPLSGEAEHRSQYKSTRVVVRGEENQPNAPDVPESQEGISDKTVISDAFQKCCDLALNEIMTAAVLPSDVLDSKPEEFVKTKARIIEHIAVDAVGAAALANKPAGTVPGNIRSAALADAVEKLIKNINLAAPGAVVSREDIQKDMQVVSEGWNGQEREYRVKAKFEADVEMDAKANDSRAEARD